MINNSMYAKQSDWNDFTKLLKLEIDMYGPVLCELRDGSYRKLIFSDFDPVEGHDALFRTVEWSFIWNLDGTSITSDDFDIVGFEPRVLKLDSPGVEFRIQKAHLLQAQIDYLYTQIDELIDPVAQSVSDTADPSIILQMVNKLPSGFHRSELRTLANTLVAANSTFGSDIK